MISPPGKSNSSAEAVLVTGANGFIGTHLVRELARTGRMVVCHSLEDGDIAHCELPPQRVAHVVHLAARTFVPDSWTATRDFYEVNVLGTLNVLEHCRRQQASLTLISSYVYGPPERLPVEESHPVRAFNPYSHTKILAEDAARFYAAQFGIPTAIIRPFNIYGPGQSTRFLIPHLVEQALDPQGAEIRVADLTPRRDHLHVRDLVRLIVLTIDRKARGTYNAGSGRSVAISEIVALINEVLGVTKTLQSTGERRHSEVDDVYADTSKAARELGWCPEISLADGIRSVIEAMAREVRR